ncbi:MAG: MupG family TIM beta-alpha barrel fold protein [Bacillota bacterium]
MRTLGISLYPNQNEDFEREAKYIETCGKLGFKRIFSCMISAGDDVEAVAERFKKTCEVANKYGMECIIDVSPVVFEKFNIKHDDLSFFKEMGASGIRLDEGIEAKDAAMMTHNKHNLKIEINASTLTKFVEEIYTFGANTDNLVSCHNFYPQKYSGLSRKHFDNCNAQLKTMNLKISAFVSSNQADATGPWPLSEGLPTLEEHRFEEIGYQARHLFMLGVDEVIISNQYASEKELQTLADLNRGMLSFKMTPEVELSNVEKEITYNFPHFVRGDMSEYMARSTFSRITFAGEDIPAKNTRDMKVGDIVILNNEYGRYKGELHIITKDMPNEGNKNVIGSLCGSEQNMLEFIKPWIPFKII